MRANLVGEGKIREGAYRVLHSRFPDASIDGKGVCVGRGGGAQVSCGRSRGIQGLGWVNECFVGWSIKEMPKAIFRQLEGNSWATSRQLSGNFKAIFGQFEAQVG